MYLQGNQQAYVYSIAQIYQPQRGPMHHHHQVYSYQQEYQQHYPAMFANQAFPMNYNMRTAIARGVSADNNNSDLLKSNTTSELSLNIPSCKDSKEDCWKFGGSNKSSSSTTLNRIDSCLESSGRSSSMGYSSDTFSPLSNASAGSRGSPQSVQENETRKIWDDKIWAAPAESSKLSTWSNNRPSSNGWHNLFLDNNRLSDPDEQNTSSESNGKCHDHQGSVLEKQSSYSSMKEWPARSTERGLNGEKSPQGLLGLSQGLFTSASPSTKRPPPGFGSLK
jgi:hypothetical protein